MSVSDARSMALRDLLPGQVLRGTQGARYFVRELIGEGGQGWVFSASWNEPDGYRVVVKVLRPDVASAETMTRFEREASVLRMLGQTGRPNPFVIRYFDHAKDTLTDPSGGSPVEVTYTVLEYVSGPTLERVLEEHRGASLPLERVRRIGGQVVLALSDVHASNVVHRDLKPSNVLLATEGGVETAKVTDFGLVKIQALSFARTVALAGATLGYAPPEQFERGNERVSPRTDVFSFAAMLFEMLTGSHAFPYSAGESPLVIVTRLLNGPRPSLARVAVAAASSGKGVLAPELKDRPDLVDRLDALIAKATAAEPSERHASLQELWTGVDPVLRAAMDRPASPPPPAIVHGVAAGPTSAVALSRAMGAVAMPAPAASHAGGADAVSRASPEPSRRVQDDPRLANPAAWYWRIRQPAVSPGFTTAAVFDVTGEGAYGCGPGGLLRWQGQGWKPALKSPPDPAGVRGLARLGDGECLAFGAHGFVARIRANGEIEPWTVPEREATFHAAHVDDAGTVTLVGERAQRAGAQDATVAILAQFVRGKLTLVSEASGCAGLRGVTRLASGALIACGTWGSLVRLELGVTQSAGAICAGHLLAVAPLPGGGAVTVGAGGHALSLSPALVAQLEAVQTTRHLLSLTVDPDGVAWAGSAQARLMRRHAGSWVRMSGELGIPSAVVTVSAAPQSVRAVCDDGTVIEGAVLSG
jgi:serine/threonine-protein kinase